MKRIISIFTVLAVLTFSGCSTVNWKEKTQVDEQHFISDVPDYLSDMLPPCDISEHEVNELGKSDSIDDKRIYENYIQEYEKYGRYDGLEMGVCSHGFYETENGCGFLLQNYGINQATVASISEIYYFDGKDYTLIDCTNDNFVFDTNYAICDGEKLYYLISNGTLRAIASDGVQTDYKNAVDASKYLDFLSLRGNGSNIEILDIEKNIISSIKVK